MYKFYVFQYSGREKEEYGEARAIENRFLGPPTSCSDMRKLGYTLNGYYLVNGIKDDFNRGKVKVVYCRFQLPIPNVSNLSKNLCAI